MDQKQKKLESVGISNDLTDLQTKFETAKNTEVPQTRMVTLLYKCLGCYCDGYRIKREVPGDSSLKDGDVVNDVLPGDIDLN